MTTEPACEPQTPEDTCPNCGPGHDWHGMPCKRFTFNPVLVTKCPCVSSISEEGAA